MLTSAAAINTPKNYWNNQPYPKFSVAPMLDVTDRHLRYFLRLLSRHTLLYSEMVTTGALLHNPEPARFLDFNSAEAPVALQLGGGNPEELAQCTQLAESWGYNEVNLNVGCPSDRVQNNKIGACLMLEPELVADCFTAMQAATSLPVTIKCRLGVDEQTDADLDKFIQLTKAAGCKIFILHARKAWLQGLSPKENREIPPLDYARVAKLQAEHPELTIALNGGIADLAAAQQQLKTFPSVMLGRAIWHSPWLVSQVDELVYGEAASELTPKQAVLNYLPYVEEQLSQGVKLNQLTKPLLGVFQAVKGARQFRRYISENAHLPNKGVEVIQTALDLVE